jgi:ribA/ribD-fused uncharacterized protein
MKTLTYYSETLGATVDVTNKRIFFWGGIFSQWAKYDVYDPQLNVHFNCNEQAMMAYKAFRFKDFDAYSEIIKETNPRKQKALGRKIKNYDVDVWAAKRLDIVTNINYLKFSQNDELKDLLLMSYPYEIVESSHEDPVWGIGMGENDPLIFDPANWKGQNLLGRAIMEAREMLIYEYGKVADQFQISDTLKPNQK